MAVGLNDLGMLLGVHDTGVRACVCVCLIRHPHCWNGPKPRRRWMLGALLLFDVFLATCVRALLACV